MILSMLVAADEANGIGVNNELLCHLPADLKYFKQITTGHCIAMGRKTFDSIGKPLPNRTNIVITRNKELVIEGCIIVHSVEEAIAFAKTKDETELVIIGGGVIFEEALPLTHKVYLTRIHHTFNADTFFPALDKTTFKQTKNEYHEADEKNVFSFSFQVYERI